METNAQFNFSATQAAVRALLIAIGENPDREGLIETPRRVAKFWSEFIEYDPGKTETAFESIKSGQLVVVSGMRVYSLCEHHLLPFWCEVSVAYVADKKVLGLSKFARIAHQFAHRLQVQERLVEQVAQEASRLLGTPDVAVTASGVHTCMTMRGIKTDGVMTSSAMLGKFQKVSELRQEFAQIVAQSKSVK